MLNSYKRMNGKSNMLER